MTRMKPTSCSRFVINVKYFSFGGERFLPAVGEGGVKMGPVLVRGHTMMG